MSVVSGEKIAKRRHVGDELPKDLPPDICAAVNPILENLRNSNWRVKFMYRNDGAPTVTFTAKSPTGMSVFSVCPPGQLAEILSGLFSTD